MKKIYYCVVLFAVLVCPDGSRGELSQEEENFDYGDMIDDMKDWYADDDFDAIKKDMDDDALLSSSFEQKLSDEINRLEKDIKASLDDYQFEDNRFDTKSEEEEIDNDRTYVEDDDDINDMDEKNNVNENTNDDSENKVKDVGNNENISQEIFENFEYDELDAINVDLNSNNDTDDDKNNEREGDLERTNNEDHNVSANEAMEKNPEAETEEETFDNKDYPELLNNDFEEIKDIENDEEIIENMSNMKLSDSSKNNYESFESNKLKKPANEDFDPFEEAREILNEDNLVKNDFESDLSKDISSSEMYDVHDFMEETDKFLKDGDDTFDESEGIKEHDQSNGNLENKFSNEIDEDDEDTVDKAFADLNDDLQNLFETINKLQDESTEDEKEDERENIDKNIDDALNLDPLDYEEKYGRPFREGLVISFRDNYYDDNLDDLFSDGNDDAEQKAEEENVKDDKVDLTHNAEKETPLENSLKTEESVENNYENIDADASIEKLFDILYRKMNETAENNDDVIINNENYQSDEKAIPYINDALIDNNDLEETKNNTDVVENPIKTAMVDDLSSSEFEDVIHQFEVLHSEDLDVHSEDFVKQVAPIHMTLSVNESLIVTSPNYPSPYPTNNIVDWIFTGEGMGIELNITDFAVNGALGDYVLVKPGGIDETGHDGLVFSYRLNSERRYRFLDVDRMFVRFESKLGMAFLRGFQFSVKMITPLPEEPEEVPEPEAVLPAPVFTSTLFLGGVTPEQFFEIEEEFRRLVADMATLYINSNGIDPGNHNTSQVTQVTRTAVCNIHWPNYEDCVMVTFGVPLVYDEDQDPRLTESDLQTMWNDYIGRDPFAARLRRLGITEFSSPNDSSVLMVWLVIATGVVISMAMLAFALWRFSCFEDYTRMKAFSDTDSVTNEKRHLDLYPTPHQTLPPLYADTDYKWDDAKFEDSARVDMGGFANKTFTRDELFDLDSDEDIVSNSNRSGAISPRSFYA